MAERRDLAGDTNREFLRDLSVFYSVHNALAWSVGFMKERQ